MLRSGNYSVTGDQWPILLYKDEIYDPEDPWRGLFRNRLLVLVSTPHVVVFAMNGTNIFLFQGIQTHFHFPKLGGQRAKGYSFRKCANTRHDICNHPITGICCYPGILSPSLLGTYLLRYIPGSICPHIVAYILSDRPDNRLRAFL